MVRDELLNEIDPSYNQMAAQDQMECTTCETGKYEGGAFELVLYVYGWADPLAFCSWSCLLKHAMKKVDIRDS